MNGDPRYRRVVEWALGRNFGRKNNRAYNSYAKIASANENRDAMHGIVLPRSETFNREVGDQKIERRDDVRRFRPNSIVQKSVTRDINVNTELQELLSKIFSPRYKEKSVYKDGKLVKKVRKGQGTGRSVKKYRN